MKTTSWRWREGEEERDGDIKITARDCGEPREIEYANEEEWPPNSRQVLYYFLAMGSRFDFVVGPEGSEGREKRKKGKPQTNLFRQAARNLFFQKPSPECRELNERTDENGGKGFEGESLNAFKSLHQAVRSHGHTHGSFRDELRTCT